MLTRLQSAVTRSGVPAAAAAVAGACHRCGFGSSASAAAEGTSHGECLYAVLGVAQTASGEELKAAFRKVGSSGEGEAEALGRGAPLATLQKSAPMYSACGLTSHAWPQADRPSHMRSFHDCPFQLSACAGSLAAAGQGASPGRRSADPRCQRPCLRAPAGCLQGGGPAPTDATPPVCRSREMATCPRSLLASVRQLALAWRSCLCVCATDVYPTWRCPVLLAKRSGLIMTIPGPLSPSLRAPLG